MRFCNLPAERQSDAGAAWLRGEEWNEQICRVHNPLAFITNDHFDAIAGFAPENCDRSLRLERGIDRIVHEINQDLFDLRPVRMNSYFRSGNDSYFKPRLEINDSLHQLAKIDI